MSYSFTERAPGFGIIYTHNFLFFQILFFAQEQLRPLGTVFAQ